MLRCTIRPSREVVVERGVEKPCPRPVERALDDPEHKAADTEPFEARQKCFQQPRRVKGRRGNQPVADTERKTDGGEARETLRNDLPIQHHESSLPAGPLWP